MGNGSTNLDASKSQPGVITLEPITFTIDPKLTGRPELPMEGPQTPSPDLLKKLTASAKSLGADVDSSLDAKGNLKSDQVEGAKKRVAEALEGQKKKVTIPTEDKKALLAVFPYLKDRTEFLLLSKEDQAKILKDAGYKNTDEVLNALEKDYASPDKKIAHFVQLKAREAEQEKKPSYVAARLYDTASALDPENRQIRLSAARAKRVWAEGESDPESKKTLLEEACVHLHAVLKKNPEDLGALSELKQTLSTAGSPQAAEKLVTPELKQLLKKEDGDIKVLKLRTEILSAVGDKENTKEAARNIVDKALAQAQNDPAAAKDILKNVEEYLPVVEEASKDGVLSDQMLDLNRLRRFYNLTGDKEKAGDYLTKIGERRDKLRATLSVGKGSFPTADQVKDAQFLARFDAHLQDREAQIQDLDTWKGLLDALPKDAMTDSARFDQYGEVLKMWGNLTDGLKSPKDTRTALPSLSPEQIDDLLKQKKNLTSENAPQKLETLKLEILHSQLDFHGINYAHQSANYPRFYGTQPSEAATQYQKKMDEDLLPFSSKVDGVRAELEQLRSDCRKKVDDAALPVSERLSAAHHAVKIDRIFGDNKARTEDLDHWKDMLDGMDSKDLKGPPRAQEYCVLMKQWSQFRTERTDPDVLDLPSDVLKERFHLDETEIGQRMSDVAFRIRESCDYMETKDAQDNIGQLLNRFVGNNDKDLLPFLSSKGLEKYAKVSAEAGDQLKIAEANMKAAKTPEETKAARGDLVKLLGTYTALGDSLKVSDVIKDLKGSLSPDTPPAERLEVYTAVTMTVKGTNSGDFEDAKAKGSELVSKVIGESTDPADKAHRLLLARTFYESIADKAGKDSLNQELRGLADSVAGVLNSEDPAVKPTDPQKRVELASLAVQIDQALLEQDTADAAAPGSKGPSSNTSQIVRLSMLRTELENAKDLSADFKLEQLKRLTTVAATYKALTKPLQGGQEPLIDPDGLKLETENIQKLGDGLFDDLFVPKADASDEDKKMAQTMASDLKTRFHKALENGEVQWLSNLSTDSVKEFSEKSETANRLLDKAKTLEGEQALPLYQEAARTFGLLGLNERVTEAVNPLLEKVRSQSDPAKKTTGLFNAATIYQEAGMTTEANSVLQEVVDQDRGNATPQVKEWVQLARGMQNLNLGKMDEAKKCLQEIPDSRVAKLMIEQIDTGQRQIRTAQSAEVVRTVLQARIQGLRDNGKLAQAEALEKYGLPAIEEAKSLVFTGKCENLEAGLRKAMYDPRFTKADLGNFFIETGVGYKVLSFVTEADKPDLSHADLGKRALELAEGMMQDKQYAAADGIASLFIEDPEMGGKAKKFKEDLPDFIKAEGVFRTVQSFVRMNPVGAFLSITLTPREIGSEEDPVKEILTDVGVGVATFGIGKGFAAAADAVYVAKATSLLSRPLLYNAARWGVKSTAEATGFVLGGMTAQTLLTGKTDQWTLSHFGTEFGAMIVMFGLMHGVGMGFGGLGKFAENKGWSQSGAFQAGFKGLQYVGTIGAFTGSEYLNEALGLRQKENTPIWLRVLGSMATDLQMRQTHKLFEGTLAATTLGKVKLGEIEQNTKNRFESQLRVKKMGIDPASSDGRLIVDVMIGSEKKESLEKISKERFGDTIKSKFKLDPESAEGKEMASLLFFYSYARSEKEGEPLKGEKLEKEISNLNKATQKLLKESGIEGKAEGDALGKELMRFALEKGIPSEKFGEFAENASDLKKPLSDIAKVVLGPEGDRTPEGQKLKGSLLTMALLTAKSPDKLSEILQGLGSPENGEALKKAVEKVLGPGAQNTPKGRELAASLFVNALQFAENPSQIPDKIAVLAEGMEKKVPEAKTPPSVVGPREGRPEAVAPLEKDGKPQFLGLEVTPQFEQGLRLFISKEDADPFVDFSVEGARVALKERNYGRAERKEAVEGFVKDDTGEAGFGHIVNRHTPESTQRGEKAAGIYAENVDVELMGRETVKSWDRASLSYDEKGQTIFILQKDFRQTVGSTTKGAETKTNQVILSADGKIISSFPVEAGIKGWVEKKDAGQNGADFRELFLKKSNSDDLAQRHGPFLPGSPDAKKENLYLGDTPYGIVNQRTRAFFLEKSPNSNANMPGTHQEEITILKKGKPVKVMATVAEMRFENPIGVREGPNGEKSPLYINRTYFVEGNIVGGYPIKEFGEKPVDETIWNPVLRSASENKSKAVGDNTRSPAPRGVAASKGPQSGEAIKPPSSDPKRFESHESRKALAQAVVAADESGLGSVDPLQVKSAKAYLAYGDKPPANADVSFLKAQKDYSYPVGGKWGCIAFLPEGEKPSGNREAWTVEKVEGSRITVRSEKGEILTVDGIGKTPMAHPFAEGDRVDLIPRIGGGSPGSRDAAGGPPTPTSHVVKPRLTDTSVTLSGEVAPSPKEPSLDRQGTQWSVRQQNGAYHGEISIYREGRLVGRLTKEDDGKSFPLKHGDQVVGSGYSFLFSNPYDNRPLPLVPREPAKVTPIRREAPTKAALAGPPSGKVEPPAQPSSKSRQIVGDKVVDNLRSALINDAKNRGEVLLQNDIHEISGDRFDCFNKIKEITKNIPQSELPKTLHYIVDMEDSDGKHEIQVWTHTITAERKGSPRPDGNLFYFDYRVTQGEEGSKPRIKIGFIRAREDLRPALVDPAVKTILSQAYENYPGSEVETRADNFQSVGLMAMGLKDAHFIEITDAKLHPVLRTPDPKFLEFCVKSGVLTGEQAGKITEMVKNIPEEGKEKGRVEVHNQLIRFFRENYKANPGGATSEAGFVWGRLSRNRYLLALLRQSVNERKDLRLGDLWVEGVVPEKSKGVERPRDEKIPPEPLALPAAAQRRPPIMADPGAGETWVSVQKKDGSFETLPAIQSPFQALLQPGQEVIISRNGDDKLVFGNAPDGESLFKLRRGPRGYYLEPMSGAGNLEVKQTGGLNRVLGPGQVQALSSGEMEISTGLYRIKLKVP